MKKEIKETVEKLKEAANAYYNEAKSILTDEQFDKLKEHLRAIDPNNDYLKSIGASVRESPWKKEKHKLSMCSLNKCNTEDEFIKWCLSTSTKTFVIQEKLDGLSLDLEYENGTLIKAITRGDGIIGEDLFENVVRMKNVEKTLHDFNGSLRGEIIIESHNFAKLCCIQDFKNPRNAAVGICHRFDHLYSNYLTVLFYDVKSDELNFETEHDKIVFLEELNLQHVASHVVSTGDAIRIYKEYIDSKRASLIWDIDGLVIKVNEINQQEFLGETGGNPAGQIAWKFPPMIVSARVLDVIWQIGKSGRITPVIHIEPTRVGGVTISKMTCHNLSMFNELKLYKNCLLKFKKSNDIIPIPLGVIDE